MTWVGIIFKSSMNSKIMAEKINKIIIYKIL